MAGKNPQKRYRGLRLDSHHVFFRHISLKNAAKINTSVCQQNANKKGTQLLSLHRSIFFLSLFFKVEVINFVFFSFGHINTYIVQTYAIAYPQSSAGLSYNGYHHCNKDPIYLPGLSHSIMVSIILTGRIVLHAYDV